MSFCHHSCTIHTIINVYTCVYDIVCAPCIFSTLNMRIIKFFILLFILLLHRENVFQLHDHRTTLKIIGIFDELCVMLDLSKFIRFSYLLCITFPYKFKCWTIWIIDFNAIWLRLWFYGLVLGWHHMSTTL